MKYRKLADQLGLEADEYFQLVELFLDVSNTDLNALEGAFEKGDTKQVTDAAHSIKGAAINLGLNEISDIAKEIEYKARQDDMEGAPDAVKAIREMLAHINDNLKGCE
jgi:HPt (histidine-containing phosphotransfer) domain-containing protein